MMNKIAKLFSVAAFLSATTFTAFAQSEELSNRLYAASFLDIAPDARGASMGDLGAATSGDIYSQYWNASKYAFNESPSGVGFSYTPWLSKLVSDIGLSYLSGYYKFDDIQAISGSFRYFSLGAINITDESGNIINNAKPNEFAFDVAYSRQLSSKYAMAIALRYFHSSLDVEEASSANGFSADISGYFRTPVYLSNGQDAEFSWGYNISNIGTKLSYSGGDYSNFIPTNMKLGAAFAYPFNDYNKFTVGVDLNKLLVPSYPTLEDGESEEEFDKRVQKYNDMSPISGIFKSFSDASFSDQLKEITVGIGAEYAYNNQFFGRMGYHYENARMGNRSFFSFGAGVKLNIFQIDASYLVASQSNALDQTFRITLGLNLGDIKGLMR
ncbi:MAG: type IX secretion system outer membrane channel protein PorV [Bacteroidales bacterium]